MRVEIKGEVFWLWRAVDEEGNVLDILMQSRRNKAAAKRFLKKLLKKQGFAPRVLVTDKLKSYAAAKKELMPHVEHRYSQGTEQPCRKLASTNTFKREENAKIQVFRSGAKVFSRLGVNLPEYSTEATSVTCLHNQTYHVGTNAQLEGDDRG